MDNKRREEYIRQIISTVEIVDSEIKILASGDKYKEEELHVIFLMLTTILRMNDAPMSHPGFTDILRLTANITDLTIEQSKKFRDSSND